MFFQESRGHYHHEDAALLSCVVPGSVYLSGCKAAKDKKLLDEHNITRVVRIGTRDELDQVYGHKWDNVEYLDIELDDSLTCHITQEMLDKTYTFINSDSVVLVHCHLGVSRSAAFVIAYIARKFNVTLREATRWTKDARPCVCPNSTFLKDLSKLFEKQK